MKAFIWSSEYVVHIAVANSIEEAKNLLLNNSVEVLHDRVVNGDDLKTALINDPVVVEQHNSVHLAHANE